MNFHEEFGCAMIYLVLAVIFLGPESDNLSACDICFGREGCRKWNAIQALRQRKR